MTVRARDAGLHPIADKSLYLLGGWNLLSPSVPMRILPLSGPLPLRWPSGSVHLRSFQLLRLLTVPIMPGFPGSVNDFLRTFCRILDPMMRNCILLGAVAPKVDGITLYLLGNH